MKQRLIDNKKNLEETIHKADKYIPALKKARERTNVTKEEIKEIDKSLKNAEAMKAKAWKRLIIIGSALSAISGVKGIYNIAKALIK